MSYEVWGEPEDPPEPNYAVCLDCKQTGDLEEFFGGICPDCKSTNVEERYEPEDFSDFDIP